MSEWQPIKTAPKNGTALLLNYASIGIAYGAWDHIGTSDWWITRIEPGKTLEWVQWYFKTGEDPTHWMHLPSPPDALSETQPSEGSK